jgi:hypothetical protein
MRFQSRSGLLVALLLSLGGCVTQEMHTATAVVAPPAAVVAASTPPARPMPGKQVGASSGKRQQVHFIAAVNPDCSTAGKVIVDFVSKPAHGTVEFEQASEFGVWAPSNPRAKCNDRRVLGTAVFYTSEPAFRGLDLFMLTELAPDGQRINLPIAVTVR